MIDRGNGGYARNEGSEEDILKSLSILFRRCGPLTVEKRTTCSLGFGAGLRGCGVWCEIG